MMWEQVSSYAKKKPVHFVAVSSFCVLSAIPLLGFGAYVITTLIASLIGVIVVELFILAVGLTGLAFVIFFVACISLCATSVFAAVYFSFCAASCTLHRSRKSMRYPLSGGIPLWPFSSTTSNPSEYSEPRPDGTDKTK